MKFFFCIILITCSPFLVDAQTFITRSIKEFGAKGDGRSDDHDAFVKASAFFNKRNGNGKLIIPMGVYIVGRQKFAGDIHNKNSVTYLGEYVLDFKNCGNLIIQGFPGAILKHRNGLRIGTFSPVDGKPFRHSIKDINSKPEYANYASNAGNMIFMLNCNAVHISGLMLDGNADNFTFGGNWGIGRNPYELIHYGIYILDSHDIDIKNCIVKSFACDGIYIANDHQHVKTYKISIDNCKVNYCGRNGLSWIGGENIRVTNSMFSNSGQGVIQESPSAGISIEVENSSFCRQGYFYNCVMENNRGSAITSGSKALSSDVLFKKCIAASPAYYTVFADAASHIFEDCSFYGTVLVWYRADSEKDAVKFRHCSFDEQYKGKKMYDGTYQLGAEATAVQVDNCTFRAYTTACYYLNALTEDCSKQNTKKIHVNNCTFYNYCKTDFKLGGRNAGIGRHTVFYSNKFYTQPGAVFENSFNANCNADDGENQFYPVIK